jgi:hypothetical protein
VTLQGIRRSGVVQCLQPHWRSLLLLQAVAATWLVTRLAIGYGRDLRARVFAQVQCDALQELHHLGAPSYDRL